MTETSLLPYPSLSISEVQFSLREAALQAQQRGLYRAAKWATQNLMSLSTECSATRKRRPEATSAASRPPTDPRAWIDDTEQDACLLAKCYFDLKEFDRASASLKSCVGSKARFLRLYSKYLAGEQRNDEEMRDILGPTDKLYAFNKESESIEAELVRLYETDEMDSFLLYLYGIILRKRKQMDTAIDMLIRAVTANHYNWSAWMELSACITSLQLLSRVQGLLPNTFVADFFLLHTRLTLQEYGEGVHQLVDKLGSLFPKGTYLKSQKAMAYYNGRNYDDAIAVFEEVYNEDQYNLDEIDVYSNILYVKRDRQRLSLVARKAVSVAKYRSETCCVIGNYYGSRDEHEKAVMYFRRALKLNRNCLSAWTLLGHEFVEMKNTNAAIEAYRRAIDIDDRDYRAWYALGQAYDILRMPNYSIYYYQKACSIRPYDTRMWNALAGVYESMERDLDAVKCYKRALFGREGEMDTLMKLAETYSKMGHRDSAAKYHKLMVEKYHEDHKHLAPFEVGSSMLFLAIYEREKGNLDVAMKYASQALNLSEPKVKEQAKYLINELREQISQIPAGWNSDDLAKFVTPLSSNSKNLRSTGNRGPFSNRSEGTSESETHVADRNASRSHAPSRSLKRTAPKPGDPEWEYRTPEPSTANPRSSERGLAAVFGGVARMVGGGTLIAGGYGADTVETPGTVAAEGGLVGRVVHGAREETPESGGGSAGG